MKKILSKIGLGASLFALVLAGCSKILEETPRAIYTPEYFKTTNGVLGGITSLYAHLRTIYGNGYFLNNCETGTDEATWGASGSSGSTFQAHDFSFSGVVPTSTLNDAAVVWTQTFPFINTANGVIENGTAVGVSPALIAEARFFRAFDYFLLVQTFGGVPLDLGAGELKFNTSTSSISVRNSVPEVYTKVIFPDLDSAVANLPVAPRLTGGLTKTAARLYLAKAYLTYGWWLENPNNIPTYPGSSRTDPNGHNPQWYYQAAYDMAAAGIDNPGASVALQPTFYDLNVGSNDRNSEVLLYADHTQNSELFNGGSLTYSSGSNSDNYASWFLTWNYTALASANAPDWKNPINSVQREAVQSLGRPWVRMAPPIDVFTTTFADKINDSRYDGTFTTVYRGNWAKAGVTNPTLYNANALPVANGDSILSFLSTDPSTAIDYSNSVYKSGVGAGVLPGRADYVIAPSAINRIVYPGLWKLGPYRTDNATGLGQPNAGSTRPYNIAKFSELYFIAAEAAVKGAVPVAGKSARELINVLRARAGKWKWSNAGNRTKIEDHSADMVAATPATITIEYILAERSREYYGEGYRWYDLVRTQKWQQLGGTYRTCGPNVGDHTPQTFTRYIDSKYYLRPIPQVQLDKMEISAADKVSYQNPAYQ